MVFCGCRVSSLLLLCSAIIIANTYTIPQALQFVRIDCSTAAVM